MGDNAPVAAERGAMDSHIALKGMGGLEDFGCVVNEAPNQAKSDYKEGQNFS